VFFAAASAIDLAARLSYGIELALIVSILVLFLVMYMGDWQKLWIQSRRTSEHLRYLPLVAPFVKDHNTNWYQEIAARRGLRIIVDEKVTDVCAWLARTCPVQALQPDDPTFRGGYISYAQELLGQQIGYHTDKAEIERTLSRRIGLASTAFFFITILCTAMLFWKSMHGDPHPYPYLRLLATVLPAVGTGLRGLLAQGETHRVAELSEGMARRLTQLHGQVKALPTDVGLPQLEDVVWNATQELLSEADTWMRLQESAPLSPAA
jgi:hypothetical protein